MLISRMSLHVGRTQCSACGAKQCVEHACGSEQHRTGASRKSVSDANGTNGMPCCIVPGEQVRRAAARATTARSMESMLAWTGRLGASVEAREGQGQCATGR